MAKLYPGTPNIWGSYDVPAGVWKTDEELWELMAKTIAKTGYEGKMGIQVDVATEIYHKKEDNLYYGLFDDKPKTSENFFELYKYMVKSYPFVIIEDPFNEDDFEMHARLTEAVDIQIVGDDLFTTMSERVKKGIAMGACNTVLLKVNQVGTISEALDMVNIAYAHGYGVMPAESRGEGVDIADYAVGIRAGSIRECSVTPPANRLLEIEIELGKRARFAGKHGIKGKRFAYAMDS
jgi:enolase